MVVVELSLVVLVPLLARLALAHLALAHLALVVFLVRLALVVADLARLVHPPFQLEMGPKEEVEEAILPAAAV